MITASNSDVMLCSSLESLLSGSSVAPMSSISMISAPSRGIDRNLEERNSLTTVFELIRVANLQISNVFLPKGDFACIGVVSNGACIFRLQQ